MVERVTDPWRTSDGKTFASRAEAEKHEGQVELADWLEHAININKEDEVTPADEIDAAMVAFNLADQIARDHARFVSLLRKAGVPLRERPKARPPADLPADFGNDTPKKPAKVAAE